MAVVAGADAMEAVVVADGEVEEAVAEDGETMRSKYSNFCICSRSSLTRFR